MKRQTIARLIAGPLLLATAMPGSAAHAASTVTITHGALAAPTLVDLGEPGESPGDMRIFHFGAEAENGSDVRVDWVMITTAVNAPEQGLDTRANTGIFSVGGGTDNQLILEGVTLYPGKGSTMQVSSSSVRVVTGGSGRFAGANGWDETTHHADGTWTHVFHLD